MSIIRIGTRGSPLAVWQAEWVRSELLARHPQHQAELVKIKTTGDKITDVPLAKVGGKGLFVKEIETALLEGHIDLAVHSMKDMPAEFPEGLGIGSVPERESPLDVLIARKVGSFEGLPKGARIGTSSLRRGAQLLHARPDLTIVPLRGNLAEQSRGALSVLREEILGKRADSPAGIGERNRYLAALVITSIFPITASILFL